MIVVTSLGRAPGAAAAAAALACAGADSGRAALLIELVDGKVSRPTLVASEPARHLEERLSAHLSDARVAARGYVCQLLLTADETGLAAVGAVAAIARGLPCVLSLSPELLQRTLDWPGLPLEGVLLRAELAEDRALAAFVARDLIARGLRVAIAKRQLPWVAAQLAARGALPAALGWGLPERLSTRLLAPRTPSHSCYATGNESEIDAAGAAKQERGDHAGAGSR